MHIPAAEEEVLLDDEPMAADALELPDDDVEREDVADLVEDPEDDTDDDPTVEETARVVVEPLDIEVFEPPDEDDERVEEDVLVEDPVLEPLKPLDVEVDDDFVVVVCAVVGTATVVS